MEGGLKLFMLLFDFMGFIFKVGCLFMEVRVCNTLLDVLCSYFFPIWYVMMLLLFGVWLGMRYVKVEVSWLIRVLWFAF